MRDTAAENRPLGRAVLMLAGLGAFFYASYGLANWLAHVRQPVPAIVFDWERAVPFLSWTILPYWTTNLFYAASLLFSRTRAELDLHARRLLSVQLLAVSCFILSPLRFSWDKPQTSGFAGFMFDQLASFDMPYNQAPSLHVALTTLFVAQFHKLLPRWAFWLFCGWSMLIIVSVMTTFQHHFIDIPTGLLAGLLVLWLWREDGRHAGSDARLTRDPARLRLAGAYAAGALALASVAMTLGGAALWLFWPVVSLVLVSAGYLVLGPSVFMKGPTGRIALPARVLLAPYRLGAFLNARLWTRKGPPHVEIAAGVWLGRYPGTAEASRFASVIDAAAEFHRPASEARWQAFPMLDLVAPELATLRAAALAIEAARAQGPVLACCALGYGRSAAAVILWLVLSARAPSLAAASAMVREKRPRMTLHPAQQRALLEACDAA